MKIKLNSVIVNDQEKALQFYTETLGFQMAVDVPAGEYRWLTVVSPDDPKGAQVVLEPDAFPAAKTYQKALFEAGIPLTAFEVDGLDGEYQRLTGLGVIFTMEPTDMGGTKNWCQALEPWKVGVDSCRRIWQWCEDRGSWLRAVGTTSTTAYRAASRSLPT
jgi:catechol 2,3-dioxygenase-like lactoylglutathione lyase family enzyme